MDLSTFINNPRITDYSFRVSNEIMSKPFTTHPVDTRTRLYTYLLSMCQGTNALYPQSNWQPHRLLVMSSLALSLNDKVRISECERLAVQWIGQSDCRCCPVRSQDFHFRDSYTYVVYGWWALVRTMEILQKSTGRPYRAHFDNYLRWIEQFKTNRLKPHLEFVKSQLLPDDMSKPEYNKPFDWQYHTKTFLPVFNRLK